jgi:thioredoxin-like negative regulator of GroEL
MTAPKAIVDFWSPGCPYCVEFKPIFEDVSASSDGSILMVEANVDADAVKTATDFKIAGLPGIVFLSNGKEVGRVEGMMSKPDFLVKIAQVFGSGAGGQGLAPGSAGSASAAPGISGAGILSGIALAGVLGGVVWGLTKVVKF